MCMKVIILVESYKYLSTMGLLETVNRKSCLFGENICMYENLM